MGFTSPNRFFNNLHADDGFSKSTMADINNKLHVAIVEKKLYKQPNLSINQLAIEISLSPKEISKFINERYQMNFSEYINYHRIEDMKDLLSSSEVEKYTLVSLAELAGFNSKSSFNATFKKMTGMTPSDYKKQHGHT